MMKKEIKIAIYCFTLLLIQTSCKNDIKQGKIKHFFKDGSGYMIAPCYIKDGDTVIHGSYSVYDKKNRLKKRGTYVNNEIYGQAKFYYDNGNIESIHFIKNDKDVGEVSWYYPNGKIEKYSFYDDLDNLNFTANYNEEGTLEECEGLILFEIYQFKLREKSSKPMIYKLGEKIRYQFMFPNIPNTERKFHFELLDYDNSKIKRTIKKIEPVTLDVQEETVKKGKNTIKAYIQYRFKDERQEILADTISFDFHVE